MTLPYNIIPIISIMTPITYYYFNWGYFSLVRVLRGLGKQSLGWITVTATLNYLLFVMCSLAELNLIWNWTAFFLILFADIFLLPGGREGGGILLFYWYPLRSDGQYFLPLCYCNPHLTAAGKF